MKKFISCARTITILVMVTIISLGFYAYMLARPVSYGMGYHAETAYDGGTFEGTIKFNSDGTMVNINTNFDEALNSRYYYKDGYIFFTFAETDEDYEAEVAAINDNFEEAVNTPFYADEIDAFKLVAKEADGYTTVYTCTSAIIFAIAGAVVEVALIGLTVASIIIRKKVEE